jgi:glycosyltransferase involved in cell wall biosynthesis
MRLASNTRNHTRLRLLTVCSTDTFFANAGMAEVERALMRALVETGGIELRVLVHGDADGRARLTDFYRDLVVAGSLHIVKAEDGDQRDVLQGVAGVMLHSLPRNFEDWFDRQQIVKRLPVVQHIHSLLLLEYDQLMMAEFWQNWRGWPPARLVAPSVCTARRTTSLGSLVAQLGGVLPRVDVIPHGVDAVHTANADRRVGRAILDVPEAALVILSLNRISPEKTDYKQLLWAFHYVSQLQERSQDLVLVLVGGVAPQDRAYVEGLEQLSTTLCPRQPIRVVEHLEEQLKPHVLAAADVLVSLSGNPQESFGIVLLEALAAGVPIVASDWNGYREALPDFYQPYLVPTLASHAVALAADCSVGLTAACAPSFWHLVETLGHLLDNAALRASLGQRGREEARQAHWASIAKQLLTLWQELDEQHRSEVDRAPPPATEDAPEWHPRSPVDGLATHYLEPHTRLRVTGLAQLDSPEADGLAAVADESALAVLAAGRHVVAGSGGTLDALTAACGLRAAECERGVLELVRLGVLESPDLELTGRSQP